MFQFHKVRLKVFLCNDCTTSFKFQFRKVRLKADYLRNFGALGKMFQFHKVRLKAAIRLI